MSAPDTSVFCIPDIVVLSLLDFGKKDNNKDGGESQCQPESM